MKKTVMFILVLASFNSYGEIQKMAYTCENKICFVWWPKLPSIKGWHQDKDSSFDYSFNAQAPDGFTFSNAESVITAKANYKPRIPNIKSINELIDDDKRDFLSNNKDLKISETTSLTTSSGKTLRSYSFFPKEKGNWELVSYGEEGDYYLIFTLSSRSKSSYDKNLKTFKQFISQYK